jgi:hypothetical protein
LHVLKAELALARSDRATALAGAQAAVAIAPDDGWARLLIAQLSPDASDTGDVGTTALARDIDRVRDRIGGGDLWPEQQLLSALMLWTANRPGEAYGALDAAAAQGYRDVEYLSASPLFAPMVATPLGQDVLRRMREASARERDAALGAPWWRASLIDPDAL